MASSIEWLNGGETWNPIRAELLEDICDDKGKVIHAKGDLGWFCTKPSPGCKNCYAEGMNQWRGNGLKYIVGNLSKLRIFLDEKTLLAPLHWKKGKLIFPCSMTDWMADFVPDEFRDKMLAVMALTPQHTYLTLTKRTDRQRKYLTSDDLYKRVLKHADVIRAQFSKRGLCGIPISNPKTHPLKNLWLGTSAEDQQRADERIPEILRTPAALRWLSIEPQLEDINLDGGLQITWQCSYCQNYFSGGLQRYCTSCGKEGGWCGSHIFNPPERQVGNGINWIVVGGESGPGARPMHPEWARSLRDQCKAAGVPFFFKQWGEWAPGECGDNAPTRTEKVATYFADKWDYSTLTPKQSEEMHRDDQPDVYLFGKKAAGRKLDGVEHSEYPEVAR